MSGREDFDYKVYMFVERIRIGVSGPFGSGKTSFIRKVSDSFDSISRPYKHGGLEYNSTLAYDHGIRYLRTGHLTPIGLDEARTIVEADEYDGIVRIDLWACAGQPRFSSLRRMIIYPKIDAFIFVVDLSRPKTIMDAAFLLEESRDAIPSLFRSIPFALVLNKRDIAVLDEVFFTRRLSLPPHTPFFFTVATEGEGVWQVVKHVVDRVIAKRRSL